MVHRRAIPPRIEIETVRTASVIHVVHRRRGGAIAVGVTSHKETAMPKTTLSFYLHIIAVAVVVFAIGSWFGGQKSDQPASVKTESVYDRVVAAKKIRCGFLTWPPLQEKDLTTGKLTGPITEYVEEVGKALDLEIVWQEEINLGTYLEDLKNNRFDVECSGGWPTAHRAKFAEYLQPVFFLPYHIFVRADDNRFSKIEDLNSADLTAAVMDGENSAMTRDKLFPATKTLQVPGNGQVSDLFLAVSTGKADFTIVDSISAKQFMASNPESLKFLTPDKPISHIAITLSVAPNQERLKHMLEETTKQLVYDGTIDKILNKYDPDKKLYVRVAKPFAGQ
ncbi:MAG: transporter substrate-binding domain-containing protein [Alphaproteobacteria bacterium]|nr:MAG: transporter substrate-binding domain-containing protein [Alphaproteobacteria bacterium]